jgi:ATP-dependent helicase/nuclease subunit A
MKLSVSELKKAAYQDEVQEEMFPDPEPEKTVPRFISGKTEEAVSGSERGTLYHRVMECLDFCAACDTEAAVREQLQELIGKGRIRKDALQLVSAEKIAAFFRSELGRRMCLAAKEDRLKKEQPFVIGIPYEEVYREEDITDTGETVMVQGIIDAYFEEEGQLILMDYKTDSVKEDVKGELTKRYKAQLQYYSMALSQMTGLPVKEKMIYAFTNGEAFCVE